MGGGMGGGMFQRVNDVHLAQQVAGATATQAAGGTAESGDLQIAGSTRRPSRAEEAWAGAEWEEAAWAAAE